MEEFEFSCLCVGSIHVCTSPTYNIASHRCDSAGAARALRSAPRRYRRNGDVKGRKEANTQDGEERSAASRQTGSVQFKATSIIDVASVRLYVYLWVVAQRYVDVFMFRRSLPTPAPPSTPSCTLARPPVGRWKVDR